MAPAGPRPPIWTARFSTLFGINFVINFAQFMTLAMVPKLATSMGATALAVGVVAGVFAVTSLAVRPVVGWATLTLRHNYLLTATVGLISLAFVAYGLSDSIPVLIAARLLHGAAMGFLAPVTLAMASDALPAMRMAQGIGVFSLGQAVATALGPSTGLWLAAELGYRSAFLCGAALLAVAASVAWRLPAPRAERAAGQRFSWRSFIAPEAVVPAVVIFLLAGAYSGVNSFIVLYGESRSVDGIGLFFTIYAVFIMVSRPLAGRVGDARGLGVVIVPGMVMFAASFVVISQARSLAGFVVAGAISAFGYGVCQPAIQTLCLISVDPSRRGVASNTNYLGVDLAYLIMPIVAGSIVTARVDAGAALPDAYSTMYLALTVPILAGLLVFVIFGRNLRGWRPEARPEGPVPPALRRRLAERAEESAARGQDQPICDPGRSTS